MIKENIPMLRHHTCNINFEASSSRIHVIAITSINLFFLKKVELAYPLISFKIFKAFVYVYPHMTEIF